MQQIIKTSGLFIPDDYTNIENIQNDLTINTRNFMTDEIETKYFYTYVDGGILIPRNYPLVETEIIDESCGDTFIDIESKIVPRNVTQIKAIDLLTNNNNFILKLNPGFGKTVTAIQAICNKKLKTIIIVPKNKLVKQWTDEILKFTNLVKDDISKLSTIKYEKLLDKKIIITTPNTIASAVTNDKKGFLQALRESGISFFIIDEIHSTVGAEKFSTASLNINAKYVVGLSATPERNNESDKILKYHVGDIIELVPDKKDVLIPNIVSVHKDFRINKKKSKYINYGGKFSILNYSRSSLKIKSYTNTVLKYINLCYNTDRNILILGNYIKELLYFAKECNSTKEDTGIFIPTADKKDILELSDTSDLNIAWSEKKIVFSTYKAARDGNNRENLDTLILLGACGNVIQAVGRINRKIENKKTPIVIEFVDTDSTIRKIWNLDKTEKIQKFLKNFEDRVEIYNKYEWPVTIYEE